MMKERRHCKRAKKYFAINIIAINAAGKKLAFDRARANPKFWDESGIDFTPKGIKIMCSKSLPEKSKIQMKMLIPDEKNLNLIRANGVIKWFKEISGEYKKYFIIGISFKDLGKDNKERLRRLWNKYK